MPFLVKLDNDLKKKNETMTINEIAAAADVSRRTVINYMKPQKPSKYLHEAARNLAKFCGYDPNRLAGWVEHHESDEDPEKQNTAPPLVA